jgi:hypothetical protein
VKNGNQCSTTGLGETSLNDKCDIYNDKCKQKCSTLLSDVDCYSRNEDCFWLFSGKTGSDGNCYNNNDNTVSCENSKRWDECTSLNKFRTDCFWLFGNSTITQSSNECKNKV